MNLIAKEFDEILDTLQTILLSILVKLGPFAVALMPALFSAYAIYKMFSAEAGPELALLFAGVVGLALETVGIVATHTAIELYNGKKNGSVDPAKFWLMAWLIPVYVLAVALTVFFSGDAFTPLVRGLGVVSPFLTCIVYIAVALARDLASIKLAQELSKKHLSTIEVAQTKDELASKEHQRALELRRLELEHQRELKKLALEEARLAKEVAPPVYELPVYSCPDCGQVLKSSSKQALGAHQRFCVVALQKNGAYPHYDSRAASSN